METITENNISVKAAGPCSYYSEDRYCRISDESASCEGYTAWCECDEARRQEERAEMEDWNAEHNREEGKR